MRKKIMTVLLVGVMFALAGCGNKENVEVMPSPTEKVEATATPEPTKEAEAMATPEPTKEAEATATPEPTKEAEATVTPEPTKKAEATATPEPTKEAEVTVTPAPTTVPEEPQQSENTEASSEKTDTVVTLGQYKGITIYEVSSEEVEEELEAMLESYTELVAVDRAAVEGDTLNINYVGKLDGVAFAGGTDDSEAGTDLTLGSGQFIDGFEEGLIGAYPGEVLDLNLTFPENYGNAELAGKAVVFTVIVNAVQESVVPELTDEFVAANFNYQTAEEFITALHDSMNQESYYNQILTELMESCTVENYPEERIEEETTDLVDYYLAYANYYGSMYGLDTVTSLQLFFGMESVEVLTEYARSYTYDIVKRELILEEIAAAEKLELTDEAYQLKALIYAMNYGYADVESFEADYGAESVRETVWMEFIMDYIISQANIVAAEH